MTHSRCILSWVLMALTTVVGAAASAADPLPPAEAIFKATGVEAGLIVVVGTTDGTMETALANRGRTVVHGLALKDVEVETARQLVRGKGLAGLVTVERPLTINPLPYTDNLANLLVADLDALGKEAPPRDEILRAVAPVPNGAAYVKTGGNWVVWSKPRPKEMDEWSHWKSANASGNRMSQDTLVKPSNAIQWMNGPVIGRGMAPLICDGRAYFCINGFGSRKPAVGGRKQPLGNLLLAFDAFSGALLWKMETEETLDEGGHSGCVRGCAGGGLLFVVEPGSGKAVALDGATGKKVVAFDNGIVAQRRAKNTDKRTALRDRREHTGPFPNRMVAEGKLVEAMGERLAAFDACTAAVAWEKSLTDEWFGHVRCGEGKVFATIGGKTPYLDIDGYTHYQANRVVCYELKTGKLLWQNADLSGAYLTQFIYGSGKLLGCSRLHWGSQPRTFKDRPDYPRPTLIGIDAASGKTLFRRLEREAEIHSPLWTAFEELGIAGDRFYIMGSNGALIFDARTGAPADPAQVLSRPWLATCQRQVGTPNYVIGPSLWFTALNGQQDEWCGWRAISRASCHSISPPAYGMNFTAPMAQDFTTGQFLGGNLATSYRDWPAPLAADQRLQKGSVEAPSKAGRKSPADEWPVYLGDRRRAASTPGKGPQSLAKTWEANISDLPLSKHQGTVIDSWKLNERSPRGPTAPVVAEGLLFVADSEGHRVLALEARTGQSKWEYETGGRIVLPPTIHQGLCLAGCQDGWLYCLRAMDGKLVWRYFAGYGPRGINICGQVESANPAVGSPLVDGDLVWLIAGRHTSTDGGAILHAVDVRSGQSAWIHPIGKEDKPKAYKFEQVWVDLLQTDVHDRLMGSVSLVFDPAKRLVAMSKGSGKGGGLFTFPESNTPVDFWRWRPAHSGARDGHTGWISFRDDASREPMGYLNHNKESIVAGLGLKIAVLGRDYYAIGGGKKSNSLSLVRWKLDEQGTLSAKPEWEQSYELTSQKSKLRREKTSVAAMIATADRIFIACYDEKDVPIIDVFDRSTGKLLDGIALPAGSDFVNNGLAAAYGRLYVVCTDGRVLCLGP